MWAVADTHAIIWYLYDDPRLSPAARTAFEQATQEGETIGVSAISLVEIVYLVEKGRIQAGTTERLLATFDDPDSLLIEMPVDREIVQAMLNIPWSQIPEMPDRIIAATALANNVPLISRDSKIQVSEIQTVW
jgi:PIN domain nuclease of toxin-antitoxin system